MVAAASYAVILFEVCSSDNHETHMEFLKNVRPEGYRQGIEDRFNVNLQQKEEEKMSFKMHFL